MDQYFDCPCGHAHHEHNWHHRDELSACRANDCTCWTYHGHRLGNDPHYVVREGLVKPTGEMEADHAVQRVMVELREARAVGRTAQQEEQACREN